MDLKEQKLADIRNQLDTIIKEIEKQSAKGFKLHEVEGHLFSSLLQLGLQLLHYYILLVAKLSWQQGTPVDSQGNKMQNKGKQVRVYFSVFGRLGIERRKYYSVDDKTHYVLDEVLGLPSSHYSYLLEDWLAFGAVELDFNQSVAQLERILGHKLYSMQSSRCTYRLSTKVEGFYGQKNWQDHKEGTHLSVGYDGKGVPIIRSQTDRTLESTSTRLGKGHNRDVKREATVSVSSSFTARKRSVDEIIKGLFSSDVVSSHKNKPGQRTKDKHTWHENKHIRAFLSDKARAITYGIDNVLKRDSSGTKPIIVLIDGDRALEKAVRKTVEEKEVAHRVDAYILDFIHLLEYVWKVANAYWGEKHPAREAWVQQQARLLLQSEWQQVVDQWQYILDNQQLSSTQSYNRAANRIQRAITYVNNRPHMIDYKTYLDKGYPITTGTVESACGHFVKSRMERNAMHWGKEGAQNMLNIRAVKKNEDWDSYIQDFIGKEQEKLYKKAA